MTTYTKCLLSGSTYGKAIDIAATSTTGTVIHQAVAGTSDIDEIWLWCHNTHTSALKLTLEWGDTVSPSSNIETTIPSESGLILIVPGFILQNSLNITAFAESANKLTIYGFVNRITA